MSNKSGFWKFAISVSFLILAIHGCSSSSDNNSSGGDRPLASRPASSTQVAVFENFVGTSRIAPQAALPDSANLLSNGGFETGLDDWHACAAGAISASSDAYEGNSALSLAPNNCVYRSISVVPEQPYALSCFIKLDTVRAWTGMGMTFASSDYQPLLQVPVAVATAGEYTLLRTTGVAPRGAGFLSLWIHSDHGATVDNCSLTQQIEAPQADPVNLANLLENGDFNSVDSSGNASYWSAGCNGLINANGESLWLTGGACVDQALSSAEVASMDNSQVTFSCLVTDSEGYSDLSIFLNDRLAAVERIDSDNIGSRVNIDINVISATNGFVSLYSNGRLRVQDCVVSVANGTAGETPPAPTNEEPVEPSEPAPVASEPAPAEPEPAAPQPTTPAQPQPTPPTDAEPTPTVSATYRLTFNATWSPETHPLNIPGNAHFSGLVGAVHNDQLEVWAPGRFASPGIELMAETGNGATLLAEIGIAVLNGSASQEIAGGGVPNAPGTVSVEFEVTSEHPLISVTTMIAPSPDWFVGVHGLSLFNGTDFIDSMIIDLAAYDSGTDSGEGYTSDDLDTQPKATISRLTSNPLEAPFVNGLPSAGTFLIERMQ